MSDRLNELRRQRALIQQQADWLDREIAACAGSEPPRDVATTPQPPASPTAPARSTSLVTPDEPVYTPDPVAASQQAKRGCFLYFGLILALLAAMLLAFYFIHYRDRPLILMEKDAEAADGAQPAH